MNNYSHRQTGRNVEFWLMMAAFYAAVFPIFIFSDSQILSSVATILVGIFTAIVIFRFPIVGFGLVINSTILADILPKISLLSSITPLLGIITITAYFLNKKYRESIHWNLKPVEILGLGFIFWLIISNPSASILGSTRSWALTFFQLWMVLWMARQFIRTQYDHQSMMIILTLGILASGIIAIQQIGSFSALSMDNRAEGLSGGANTAARYFLYGIIILFYLQGENKKKMVTKLIQIVCIILLTVALFFTGSRSGILLLFVFVLLRILPAFSNQKRSAILLIPLLAFVFILIEQTNVNTLRFGNIIDSIINGSNTVGYRYSLWEAGYKMGMDHPIAGVGIGRFGDYLPLYWPAGRAILANTAHNTFVEVFAETGIVGGLIFFSLLITSILKFIKIIRTCDKPFKEIYKTWMLLIVILLIGSLTKADLIDKFLWFLLGLDFPQVNCQKLAHRSLLENAEQRLQKMLS